MYLISFFSYLMVSKLRTICRQVTAPVELKHAFTGTFKFAFKAHFQFYWYCQAIKANLQKYTFFTHGIVSILSWKHEY